MWNTIKNIAQRHLDTKTAGLKFGQRVATFGIAVGLFEGLSLVSSSLDDVAKAVDSHGTAIERAATTIADALDAAARVPRS